MKYLLTHGHLIIDGNNEYLDGALLIDGERIQEVYYQSNKVGTIDDECEVIDLKGINKLMIVAHPDDDFIWGGSHLLDDDYLVVCITCGVRRVRVLEFGKAMDKTNDKSLMLGYPDKTNGKRDNWDKVYSDITADLKKIIEYKDSKQSAV